MPARPPGSMYVPYRALGQVCDGAQGDGAAPTMHRRGKSSFLTAPVAGGRVLHIYDTNLRLKGVSRALPNGTTAGALAAVDDYVFVAAKTGGIHVLRRMRFLCTWGGDIVGVVNSLLVVGGSLLVAAFGDVGRVVVWRIPTHQKSKTPNLGEVVADVSLPDDFKASVVAHPPTYVNKILLGAHDGRLLLLNIRTQKIVYVFPGFQSAITALAPSPVLDVVAVGTNDGRIVLHNIRMDESVCTLRHGFDESLDGVNGSSKTHRAASDTEPSSESEKSTDDTDVVMGVVVPKSSLVSVISFCTDGSETVVTGDAMGNLAVWSLNDQALTAVARSVHAGGIAFAAFLPGESVLITAGLADNAIKVHVFDGPMRNARVLRSREGHRLPPTRVRFSGSSARMLISAGLDREVRIVSAVQDAQNRSFSQRNVSRASARVRKRRRANAGVQDGAAQQLSEGARRLPVVTGIATSSARHRDKDFANVVTIHAGRREAYTWRAESGAMHRLVLRPPKPPQPLKLAFQRGRTGDNIKPSLSRKEEGSRHPRDGTIIDKRRSKSEASAVVMSHCGNFALLGLSNGEVHSFNLQSGIHHGAFVADTNYRTARSQPSMKLPTWGRAHKERVTGLAVDACGDAMVSAGGKSLKFWNLRTREPIGEALESPASVTSVFWSKASDLLAVVCEDFGVYVYDTGTRKLARRLIGHGGAITDASFDSEGRRVVTSSMDGSIKTWDLPSGRAIDTLRCDTAPTSVAIGPGGEFIASCHVNSLSISLWVDRSKFCGAHRSCAGAESDSESEAGNDSRSGSDVDVGSANEAAGVKNPAATDLVFESGDIAVVSSLASDLITLSGRPTTQWTTLANLDAIKQRNKPIQPPKKPEQLPFFLPTVKGLTPKFDVEAAAVQEKSVNEHKTLGAEVSGALGGRDDFFGNSHFGSLVSSGNFTAAYKLMAGLGPSGVDMELRTIEGAQSRMGAANYFLLQLESRRDFEIIQAQLDVFLKAHGRDLACDEEGAEVLAKLSQAQDDAWSKLRQAFDSVLTLSSYFAGYV